MLNDWSALAADFTQIDLQLYNLWETKEIYRILHCLILKHCNFVACSVTTAIRPPATSNEPVAIMQLVSDVQAV